MEVITGMLKLTRKVLPLIVLIASVFLFASAAYAATSINDESFTLKSVTYNGREQQPQTATLNGKTLYLGNHYYIDSRYQYSFVDAGSYRLLIWGKGPNYSGTKYATYEIKPVNLSVNGTVVFAETNTSTFSTTFTGELIRPELSVTYGNTALVEDTDYTLSSTSGTVGWRYPGTYTIKVTGKGNYTGGKNLYFTILPKSISGGKVTSSDQTYTGGNIAYKPAVTLDGKEIPSYQLDYTYTDSNGKTVTPKDAGSYKVKITGKKDYGYDGTIEKEFKILPLDLSNVVFRFSETSLEYTGSARYPTITATYNNNSISGWSRQYTDPVTGDAQPINAGRVKVTFSANSKNLTGSVVRYYNITPKKLPDTASYWKLDNTVFAFDGTEHFPKITYSYSSGPVEGKDFTAKYGNNLWPGTNTAWVEITGKGNYQGTYKRYFSINKANRSAVSMSFGDREPVTVNNEKRLTPSYQYDGSEHKPAVKLALTAKDGRELVLTEKTDYTVSYSNSKDVYGYPFGAILRITIQSASKYVSTSGGSYVVYKYDIMPVDLASAQVTVADQQYTGQEVKPVPVLKYNGREYDLSQINVTYKNNVKVGTASVTLAPKRDVKNFKNSKTVEFRIKGKDEKVSAVALDRQSFQMLTKTSDLLPGQKDASVKLTATVSPAEAKDKSVKWTSSNTAVATVDKNGRVTGLKPGTATITVKTNDGGKTASCKVQVLSRKEYKLTEGAKYTFNSRLGREYSMDVMYQNCDKNTNVSLYKTTAKRNAQIFTAEKKVVNGKTCWVLIRTNKYVGKRAVTEINGKNIVFGTAKYTNWQLFRVYRFNDGSLQFINRGSNNAISVVGGKSEQRGEIAPEKANLAPRQRWFGVLN